LSKAVFVGGELCQFAARVRFNLSAMDDALAAIDAAAQKSGLTRSAYMVQSSLEKAGSASWKEL
jgi:uncharacterized protein (DUF1778 family)